MGRAGGDRVAAGPLEANLRLLAGGGFRGGTIRRLAYLTDTVGLPADSASRLLAVPLDLLVLDCSMPPQERPPRNHNDLTRALECIESLRPRRAVLTHVGHTLDAWLLDHPAALPEGVELARDGMCLPL